MSSDESSADESDPDPDQEITQIRVTKAQRAQLHEMLGPGERYRDAVAQLLEERDCKSDVEATTSTSA